MHKQFLYLMGKSIYALRWPIIMLWLVIIGLCIPVLPHIMAPFKITGFIDEQSPSAIAQKDIDKRLGYNSNNQFVIIYHSPKITVNNPLFMKKIKYSLSSLDEYSLKYSVILPYAKHQHSKDKHTAYAVVIIKSKGSLSPALLKEFEGLIKKPSHMILHIGGQPLFVQSVNEQTQKDLYKADYIATPFALITLFLVFGSLFAAMLPIILGGGCALMILTTLYFIGHHVSLSIFTLNIALLLGLCLSLDYSLFIINRFREELHNSKSIAEVLARTQKTAGKAVFFSGLAVFVSLSALFLFPINILFSVAVGGLVAVFMAVLVALVFLPAVLAIIKGKVNWLSIHSSHPNKSKRKDSTTGFWHWLAMKVVRHPFLCFFPIMIVLLALGYPFLKVQFGVSDFRIFPKESIHRVFYDSYTDNFNAQGLNPILIGIHSSNSAILSKQNISRLYNLSKKIENNKYVDKVQGIVSGDQKISKSKYYMLYRLPKNKMSDALKQALDANTKKHFTVLSVLSKYSMNSPQTKELIQDLKKIKVSPRLKVEYTGTPVSNQDVLNTIFRILPYALIWIFVFTYLILFLLLRSIVLPIQAIFMNILSLSACYGALVLVFQEGYLASLLHFDPQGELDISLIVIIFCALFGFSMDYEVFLLSRIKEAHDASGDNDKSIVVGIEKSSRIITSAALIVIVICAAFLVADVLMVKAFGLGIAVAIFVDAFLIRTLLVPSTMAIFKSWNWYLPQWLDRILPKF